MVYIVEFFSDNKCIRVGSGLEIGILSGYILVFILVIVFFWMLFEV